MQKTNILFTDVQSVSRHGHTIVIIPRIGVSDMKSEQRRGLRFLVIKLDIRENRKIGKITRNQRKSGKIRVNLYKSE